MNTNKNPAQNSQNNFTWVLKKKEKAAKQASTGYRFKKYSTLLCNDKGYGWGLEEVLDKGELICEPCEGEYEGKELYRCYMKDVKVKCKRVVL